MEVPVGPVALLDIAQYLQGLHNMLIQQTVLLGFVVIARSNIVRRIHCHLVILDAVPKLLSCQFHTGAPIEVVVGQEAVLRVVPASKQVADCVAIVILH